MSYEDYDLNPVKLALDLASLGDGGLSLEQVLGRQRRMFSDHGYPCTEAELDPGHRRQLAELGGRIAGVLGAAGDEAFLAALAALLEEQDCKPHLTMHDGAHPHLHYARDGAPLPVWMGSMAASGLVLHVCRHGRGRLRRCAAAGCGLWFVDESKNCSRRYCSNACASRTTVAAYRARASAKTSRG